MARVRIVVTGGAGFIGANLVRRLEDEPDAEVVVVDDLSTGIAANLDGRAAELVEGSVLSPDVLADAFRGADCVVHLAAIPSVPRSLADPLASHHANATGTLQVLESARAEGIRHLVVASSSSVYGASEELPKRESARPRPLSPYAVSKLATETYALAYAECFGLDVLAFRFFNVFGPLQAPDHAYAAVVPRFVAAALRGEPLVVHGDGDQSRDFTYIGSVCDVLHDAVVRRVSHDDVVNLAFGSRTTLNELTALLGDVVGAPLRAEHVAPRPGDVRHSQADDSRVRTLFPHVAPVPLERGLRETVDWMRSAIPG